MGRVSNINNAVFVSQKTKSLNTSLMKPKWLKLLRENIVMICLKHAGKVRRVDCLIDTDDSNKRTAGIFRVKQSDT